MEPVSNIGSTAASASVQPRNTAPSSDYETFLLMLTTQLENQDPTDPADADELAVQLATFSGVEQQTFTNDLLRDLIAQTSLSGLAELGNWVGKEVLADGPISFSGAPIELDVSVPAIAEKAELVVYREGGAEVQRTPIDARETSMVWAGAGPNGAPLANGRYEFRIEATALDQPISGGTVRSYREVSEARVDDGTSYLISKAGDRIAASDVLAIR